MPVSHRSGSPVSLGSRMPCSRSTSPSASDCEPYHLPDGSPQPLPWETKITPPPKIIKPKLSQAELDERHRKEQAKIAAKERMDAERARAVEEREAKRALAAAEKVARQAEAARRKAAAEAIAVEVDAAGNAAAEGVARAGPKDSDSLRKMLRPLSAAHDELSSLLHKPPGLYRRLGDAMMACGMRTAEPHPEPDS